MFKEYLSRDLIRPIIYKLFTRLIYGTLFSLLADFFISDPLRDIRSYGFALCACLCFFGAWMSYLRVDGFRIPRLPEIKLPRKHPTITYGDIDDHIDDDIRDMEELSEGEKETAQLIADVILAIVFIILSIII